MPWDMLPEPDEPDECERCGGYGLASEVRLGPDGKPVAVASVICPCPAARRFQEDE